MKKVSKHSSERMSRSMLLKKSMNVADMIVRIYSTPFKRMQTNIKLELKKLQLLNCFRGSNVQHETVLLKRN